ncbi:MAG TPA: pirin family protein, partial [Nitrospiraceae bacterium]|nr:pirin family protein [Nitrospiraceae bacterium]
TQHIDSATTSRSVTAGASPLHTIVQRTRGNRQGPITRLMSPGDLGEVLKPFVFLDLFDMEKTSFPGLGLHPHSGIATVSYLFEGDVCYEDTSGATGILTKGGVEWFKAGHGAWHGGGPGDSGRTRGFQLWVALPPEQELAAVESVYQAPDAVKRVGPARVLVGTHGGVASPLKAPVSMNYLAVRLKAGESWSYQPPAGHTVGWIGLATGRLLTPGRWKPANLRSSNCQMVQSTFMPRPIRNSCLDHRCRIHTILCSAPIRCIPAPRRCGPVNNELVGLSANCRSKVAFKFYCSITGDTVQDNSWKPVSLSKQLLPSAIETWVMHILSGHYFTVTGNKEALSGRRRLP